MIKLFSTHLESAFAISRQIWWILSIAKPMMMKVSWPEYVDVKELIAMSSTIQRKYHFSDLKKNKI